ESRHLIERTVECAPVVEIRRCHAEELAEGRMAFPKSDETIWMGVWKGLEKDAVDDAIDCGVCADAEREREDGNGGESGILPKTANGVTHVLHEDLEPNSDTDIADVLFNLLHATEIAAGLCSGSLWSHATADVFRGGEFEVGAEFVIEFLVR